MEKNIWMLFKPQGVSLMNAVIVHNDMVLIHVRQISKQFI